MANVATLGAKATFDVSNFTYGISKMTGGLATVQKAQKEADASLTAFGKHLEESTRTPMERYRANLAKIDQALAMNKISMQTHSRAMAIEQGKLQGTMLSKSVVSDSGAGLIAAATNAAGFAAALVAVNVASSVANAGLSVLRKTVDYFASGLKWGAALAMQSEKAQIGFEVMLKSGSLAKQMMKDIESFALATPFDQAGVTQQLTLLKGMGITTEELLPTLKTLGDLSLGDMDKLGGLALAFGQVTAKGKLMSQEFNQLAERGINLRQDLANNLKIPISEVAKAMEDGKISAVTFRNALIDLAERDFAGMMDKQSNSVGGMLDKLKENTGLIFKDIATQMGEAFGAKDILSSLNDTLTSIRETVKQSLGMIREAKEIAQFMRDYRDAAYSDAVMAGSVGKSAIDIGGMLGKSPVALGQDIGRFFSKSIGGPEASLVERFGRYKDTLKDRYEANQNGYGMMDGAYNGVEAYGGMKKAEPPVTTFSKLGVSIGNGIKSSLLNGTDFLKGLAASGYGMARNAGGFINSLKVPENREYRPTGALVAGSSEAYSAEIRNMFKDKQTTIEEKQLEELKRIAAGIAKMAADSLKDGFKGLGTIESFLSGAGGAK